MAYNFDSMTPVAENAQLFLSLIPLEENSQLESGNITEHSYFGFPIDPIVQAEQKLLSKGHRSIAYFSMEYGLSSNTYNALQSTKPISEKNFSTKNNVFSNLRAMDYYLSVEAGHRLDLPIYSGGLGVLAGDTLKSAADLGISLAAVGILWNKGYFKQNFWFKDGQVPEETNWDPHSYPGLIPLKTRIEVPLRKETIHLKLWKYFVYSYDRQRVIPLILLDSNLKENSEFTRSLTGQLYRSDNAEWKILQRLILGIGGMKALNTLGYAIDTYHLNEGHAALAFIGKAKSAGISDLGTLKKQFAYTCHTPVAAGHDRFLKKTLQDVMTDEDFNLLKKLGQDPDNADLINLTQHAMNASEHINAVAQKHGEVTRAQFPQHKSRIEAITNGVHAHTWVSDSVAKVLDKHSQTFGDWRKDPLRLKKALELKDNRAFREDLWSAHQQNKNNLATLLKSWRMDPDTFTLCWARRIAAYKRPSMILQDVNRLLDIAKRIGPIQILIAGKAHPKDDIGFTKVNEMLAAIDTLDKERDHLRVLMLENYDTYFGKLLSNSVDVWLNNPLPPFEASGTSGMKAILNGVLQLSTLDGWVVEAADKNIGWIFGWEHHSEEIGDERNLRLEEDAQRLYEMLERVVTLYYQTNQKGKLNADSDWLTKMAHCISEAGFFNTQRMVQEYQSRVWKF